MVALVIDRDNVSDISDIVLSANEKEELEEMAMKKFGVEEECHLLLIYSMEYLETYMTSIKESGDRTIPKSHFVENAVMEMAFRYYLETVADSLKDVPRPKQFFGLKKINGLGISEEGFYKYLMEVTGYRPPKIIKERVQHIGHQSLA